MYVHDDFGVIIQIHAAHQNDGLAGGLGGHHAVAVHCGHCGVGGGHMDDRRGSPGEELLLFLRGDGGEVAHIADLAGQGALLAGEQVHGGGKLKIRGAAPAQQAESKGNECAEEKLKRLFHGSFLGVNRSARRQQKRQRWPAGGGRWRRWPRGATGCPEGRARPKIPRPPPARRG